ncbi:hypothetical protein EJ08DRAFT_645110 [Tothia fuscella]|uniref:Heterokaryon incompatibility domain-containing protein n=1 Tax=Tothia fuscella TaxID=1048955 RepID=A0A9P4U3M4_9PEZI|nr:hypothetical protein EJ08DRAFT_645110 [Tothia fuscella]
MGDNKRHSSLRRRLSCRLSLFRRASTRQVDDDRPKSRALLHGPECSPRYLDILEVTQEKSHVVVPSPPKTIGSLADDLDSKALRMVMQTAERRRDTERRRSIIQLGFRLAHLNGQQYGRKSSATDSDGEFLLQEEHAATHGRSPSMPVSMVFRSTESEGSPRPASVIFRSPGQRAMSPRPASMIFSRNPESRKSSRSSMIIVGRDSHQEPAASKPLESRASSRASMIMRSPTPQSQFRPEAATLNRSADPQTYIEPTIEVGIRVGEFDPKLRKPYLYSPLQTDRVIRLLSLRRPSVDGYKGGFYYQIMIMSLDDPVPYESVSYLWGNLQRACRLNFMDGSYLPITESLAQALPEISTHCKTGYLFIDQISIDHANVSERNYQAKIAGDITRRASRMLVSLEFPSQNVKALLPLVDLAWQYESSCKSVVHLQWALAPFLDLDPQDASINATNWRSVVELLSHNWFMRTWVFQEVVLSQSVAFIFEKRLVPFDAIVHLALATSRLETDSEGMPNGGVTTQPGFHQLYSMVQHRSNILFGKPPDFWQLLSDTAPHGHCSDDRDSLYALLGFLNDDRVNIQPNYRIALHDVFVDAAKCFIDGQMKLDILSFVPRAMRDSSGEEGVPSWVPDWRKPGEVMPLLSMTKSSPFKASEGRSHYVPMHPKTFRPMRLLLNRLHVKGKVIDSVANAKMEPFADSGQWMSRDLHEFLRLESIISYLDHTPYSTPEDPQYSRERVLKVQLADGALLHDTPEFSKGVYLSDQELTELALAYRHFDSPDPFDSSRFQLASFARNIHTLRSLSRISLGRRLFVAADGRLGLAHHSVEAGDLICVLHGSRTPIVLKLRSDGRYETKGQCYFEDAMYGETVDWEEDDGDEFVLV